MKVRGITEDEVLKTIRHPTKTGLRAPVGRFHVRKTFTRYRDIDVVYELSPGFVVVVTTWDRKGAPKQR
jgi:hypothetical protein